ncbi:MAG: DUF3987 domain-containing protein [Desulfamplus sp.]|nr:DUF3987 domain-containing protein [Desulfamplus sp.]
MITEDNTRKACFNQETIQKVLHHIQMITAANKQCECQGKAIIASYGQDSETGQDIPPKVKHISLNDRPETIVNTISSLIQDQHRNVYMPLCLMREDLAAGKKGSEKDIVAVLGLVADFDDDEADKWAERLPLEPSYVLETSQGRYQAAYLFNEPVTNECIDIVKSAAALLQKYSGCDFGTKDLSHIWRIDCTLNWPNKKKVEGGRPPEPQQVKMIKPFDGNPIDFWDLNGELDVWAGDQAEQEQPENIFNQNSHSHEKIDDGAKDQQKNNHNVNDDLFCWNGDIESLPVKPETKTLIKKGAEVGKRSQAIQRVINALIYSNLTDHQINEIFHKYPIGEKYREKSNPEKWLQPQIDKGRIEVTARATARHKETGSSSSTPEEWQEPQRIENTLLPVKLLPDEAIPEPFKGWIKDIACRWAVPVDFPFVSAVIVAGAVIGAGCRIKPKMRDNWAVVPNVWGGVVADPSKLKSPVLNEIINKSIGRLEGKAAKAYQSEKDIFDSDKFINDTLIKMKKKDIETLIKDNTLSPATPSYPSKLSTLKKELLEIQTGLAKEPVQKRYKVNDCSVEKYVELNKENKRGLIYYRDELPGLFARWDKAGNESDRALMLEGWNGQGNYTDDRIGRGTIRVENLCVSICGGVQPDKIVWYLHQAMSGGDNDGFVQRLQLMVYPDKTTWQYVDRYPDTIAKNRFYDVIEALAEMDFTEYGAYGDEDVPYYRFTPKAQLIFEEWFKELHRIKLENIDDDPIIIEHLGKYRSLMPSLALIFHLVEIADGTGSGQVSDKCALQSIIVCEYLESHARRIYGMVTNSERFHASKLAAKIKQKKIQDSFTLRDVYIKNWHLLNDKESVQKAVDYLIEKKWIREATSTQNPKGGRPSAQYEINPKIFKNTL